MKNIDNINDTIDNTMNDTTDYIRIIRDLKMNNTDINIKTLAEEYDINNILNNTMSIDDIIVSMEEINKSIGEFLLTETRPIKEHLEYMINKPVHFEDKRFDNLFIDRNVSAQYKNANSIEVVSSKKATNKNLNKTFIDYSYRPKMAGFISKTGKFSWDSNKIDDFIAALKNN